MPGRVRERCSGTEGCPPRRPSHTLFFLWVSCFLSRQDARCIKENRCPMRSLVTSPLLEHTQKLRKTNPPARPVRLFQSLKKIAPRVQAGQLTTPRSPTSQEAREDSSSMQGEPRRQPQTGIVDKESTYYPPCAVRRNLANCSRNGTCRAARPRNLFSFVPPVLPTVLELPRFSPIYRY